MWPNPQETADLVTFTGEILNGKLNSLCSEIPDIRFRTMQKTSSTVISYRKEMEEAFSFESPINWVNRKHLGCHMTKGAKSCEISNQQYKPSILCSDTSRLSISLIKVIKLKTKSRTKTFIKLSELQWKSYLNYLKQ